MRNATLLAMVCTLVAFSTASAIDSTVLGLEDGELPRVEVLSSDDTGVSFLFELPEMSVEELSVGNSQFQLVTIPGGVLRGDVGAPSLPSYARLVAIPDASGVQVSVVIEQEDELNGFNLLPMQADEGNEFAHDLAAYSRDSYNDDPSVSVGSPAIMRDLRVVPITFRPVKYNPVRGTLSVARRMRVDVDFTGTDFHNARQDRRRPIAPSFDEMYREVVVNYAEWRGARDETVTPGTYLVICPNNSEVTSRLQPLLDWRERKGTPVYLATTSETGTSRTQIKNFIQNAYNNWANPPEYVVFAGDADGSYTIPTWFESSSGYNGEGDHPYCQLEGGDVLADVHLGRLSFGSTSELETIVAKSTGYENNPSTGTDPEWFTRACLVGDPSASGPSTITVQRWIKSRLLQIGYTDVDTVFSGSYVTSMRNALNLGDTIFSYRGYYGMSGWTNSNTNQLSNTWELPFCIIITCDTGSFASGTARSEGFLRAGTSGSPKGGIGAIGTATIGTHTRYNNCMHYGILRGLLWDGQTTMGSALTRGKLELYMNYIDVEATQVLIWSHWNTLMGDAGVDIFTGYPEPMTVTHPTMTHIGANAITVEVEDDFGFPIADAQVCLMKGSETYSVGHTNSSGELELPVNVTTIGEILVTVTKHNQHPHFSTIPVYSGGTFVAFNAASVDDDQSGSSSGNGDGLINPGETIELQVQLKNFGTIIAEGVSATLSSTDPYVIITDATEDYGDISGGAQVWSPDDFDVTISPACPNSRTIRFGLDVTSGRDEWHSLIDLDVVTADLVTDGQTLYGSGNGRLDPGETVELSVELRNNGDATATSVFGTLESLSPFVSVLDASGSYGTIGVGGTAENTSDRYEISADPGAFEGHVANFNLITQFNGSVTDTAFVTLTVGLVSSNDPVGPDMYGYYAFDNTDTGYQHAPVYNWIEIDPSYGGSGTVLPLNDNGDGQDASTDVDLPFDFQYYGVTYDRATVCSNGWLAMGSTWLRTYRNWTIPGAGGPDAMLAVFWDDLEDTENDIYHYYDEANHRWIVEWSRVRNDYGGASETFQAILYDPAHHPTETGDGIIEYQYNDITVTDPVDGYCTVGIENQDQSDGVLYTFFNQYPGGAATLTDGRAIRFVAMPITATGRLEGTVTNGSWGNTPIEGAEVTLLESGQTLVTGPSGTYGGMVSIGSYTVSSAHPSFEPDTAYGVSVIDDGITNLDFSLTDIGGPIITTQQHASTNDTLGPYSIIVNIEEYSGLAEKTLHYSLNGGEFVPVPMTSIGDDEYVGSIPGQTYGTLIEYYIYARDELDYETVDPPGAPIILFAFTITEVVEVLDDDFELDQGWTIGAAGDNASTGVWIWADPVGTEYSGNPVQPEDDHTADPGVLCYVTGNTAVGGGPGDNDVDGGKTTLLSPVFDLSEYTTAELTYWVWYTNDRGNDPNNDYWDVDVTANGSNWFHLENTTQSTNAWVERTFLLEEHVTLSNTVQLRYVAADEGDGSLVEAAVDDFLLIARNETVGVDGAVIATDYGLDPCHPNPFNPMTTITYRVPTSSSVKLQLYDVNGRLVRTLVDGRVDVGQHSVRWDGRTDNGRAVASGVYFMRLEAPGYMQVRQLTLLR